MAKMTDRELEELYESGDRRINQERNDFLLPQILDFVNTRKWLNLRPEYQRRQVWDDSKRSRFIESLLMNLPIPAVFLFEVNFNRYEVIDGQQRLSAISDFYDNRYKLKGLERWKDLNGKKYADLPPVIQSGIDRRRVSATVILAESLNIKETRDDIRRLMFERLNTGGQNLNHQELRNCLYSGLFNDMLIRLAGYPLFNDIWGVPRYKDNIRGKHISSVLAENALFKRMGDCEIVLRFFAFRKRSRIKGSVRRILDQCMVDNLECSEDKISQYENDFKKCLNLAHDIFGDDLFRLPLDEKGNKKLSQPLFDAIMLAVDCLYDYRDGLIERRDWIKKKISDALKIEEYYDLIVAKANTASAIKERLDRTKNIFMEVF